ncbi:MAG: LysR substrate-binding domain-containing protein, partial [Rhodocyclaceae bacterium]
VAAGHRLAQARAMAFAEVLGEAFVALAPGSALQDHIDEQARRLGRTLSMRIRMNSFEGLCEMVAQDIGVAIVPQAIARQHRRRYGYHVLPLADDWARRQLCLCWRDWSALSTPMRSLLTHLGGHGPA